MHLTVRTVLFLFQVVFSFRRNVVLGETTTNPVVEGFEGGSVTLPCTLTVAGNLEWRDTTKLILLKSSAGAVVISGGVYKDVISLEGGTDLRISSLDRSRDDYKSDGGGIFICLYTDRPNDVQETPVRVLGLITGVQIDEASGGTITVTEGVSKTLTCTVTGDPNPAPNYSWRVDGGPISGLVLTFSLTADRSMTTVTCTATNTYSNRTELSRKVVTASLNVHYLGSPTANTPVTATEGDYIIMRCSAEGNPPPVYVWTRSGSSEVISTTGDYTVEGRERSAAGEYTCTVTNTVGERQTVVTLIVQYPPKVSLTYNNITRTLTCTAEGVPTVYSFKPWEHRLGGKLLRTLGTASIQSPATLRLDGTLTYEDTGEYVCKVSNGVKGEQRAELRVVPQTAAVFQPASNDSQLTVGMTGDVSVSFYTHSVTPSVTVEWRKSGAVTPLPSHREEARPVSLTIRSRGVSIGGTVSTLTLTDVTVNDGGYYTVTVNNVIGGVTESRHVSVFINVTEQPQSTNPAERTTRGSPIGGIVGGVVGAVVLILVVVGAIVFFRRRRTGDPRKTDGGAGDNTTGLADDDTDRRQIPSPEGQVYQKISVEPEYANSGMDQQYATMKKNTDSLELTRPQGAGVGQNVPYYVEITSKRSPHYENPVGMDSGVHNSEGFYNI